MLLKPTKFYKALPNSSEVSPVKDGILVTQKDLLLSGFTLIELLVVIVIITILASVLLITFKGVDEKAKLTNLIQFSQSQRTAFFTEMVGRWLFDELVAEGTSTTTIDNSFQRNNGIVQGGVTVAKGIINGALKFDGVSGGVEITGPALQNDMTQVTIAGWMYVNSIPTFGEALFSANNLAYGCTYYTDGRVWCYIHGGGNHIGILVNTQKWHYIVETFDGTTMKLYLDGAEKASKLSLFSSTGGSSLFLIGRGSGYYSGLIDEVQIYNTALPLAVIQQHYAEGLKRHQNLARNR